MKSRHPVTEAEASKAHFDVNALEEVLACNIKDVLADFCLTDAEIIRSYVNNQLHGNMDEIFSSSTELFFKGHTLSYAHSADISTAWGHPPCIVLDMEFSYGAVNVLFKLVLGECSVGIHIIDVLVSEKSTDDFDPHSFAEILTSARLTPLPTRFRSAYCPSASVRH